MEIVIKFNQFKISKIGIIEMKSKKRQINKKNNIAV